MLKKLFSVVLFVILFNLVFFKLVKADDEFLVDSNINYEIEESGITHVNQNIIIENLRSDLYATSWTIELNSIDAKNIKSFQDNHEFEVEVNDDSEKVTVKVLFDDPIVGKGKSRNFNIAFDVDGLAVRTGEIWEISIPRLSEESNFRNYSLSLAIPFVLGEEAYISPEPNSKTVEGDRRIYSYNKKTSQELGITAGFGNFQVFSFSLSYHIENPLNKVSLVEIAIPPDTSYQKLYYELIDPKPKTINIDPDGNWLAVFELSSRQRIDVTAKGSVQIFAGPRPFLKYPEEILTENLKSSEFWQTTDPEIQSLAKTYKTPFEIYEFVSKNLTYDFERVSPETKRLGALVALSDPDSAICMEYTDTFIAIARAANIPAREINGYAYTENPDIQPLSLVSDVLHAWPEYWDYDKKTWIPVDPTWASTTGGVDYFNKLDLRHFTFVIHGVDAQKPYPPGSYKLGPNPQKDVFVNFGQLPEKRTSNLEIYASFSKTPGIVGKNLNIIIKNPGPSAIYNSNAEVYFDKNLSDRKEIDILPPFSQFEFQIYMPYGILGSKAPETVQIISSGQTLEISTNKNQIITYNLSILLIILMSFLILIIFRLKRINLWTLAVNSINKIKTKLNAKFRKNQNIEKPL